MKAQLKNLKQFRKFKTRAKFQFYVVFRPKAQKWFFVPALVYIVFLGVNDWYDKKWDGWNFINETNAGSLEILTNDSSTTSPVVDTKSPSDIEDSVQVETKNSGSAGSPVAPQVEVINLIHKYFPEEKEIAVAIFKGESGLNPIKESDTDRMGDGRAFSAGLAQINLTVSEVGGVNCTKAFSGQSYKAKVIDEAIYKKCLELSKNPVIALEAARKKYEGRNNTFKAWSVFTKGHYEKFLDKQSKAW